MTGTGIGHARRSLARHLVELREKSGMTYEQMLSAGLPAKSTWNRYERGLISPDVSKVAWACDVFKTSPDLKEHLVQLAGVVDGPTWYESHVRGLPTMPGFIMLLEMESLAQPSAFSALWSSPACCSRRGISTNCSPSSRA